MSTAASRPASEAPWPIVVMGVSGSGKSSVGGALAAELGLRFVEGDALHPPANIDKMAAGIPLEDEDRWPWLERIGAEIAAAARQGDGLVVSCSALKRGYRDRLRQACGGRLRFVFLQGSRALLQRRMRARRAHFMPASLLDSQLAVLEEPGGETDVLSVDVAPPLHEVVEAACRGLGRLHDAGAPAITETIGRV